ncbi:MAG TPA: hypothetical protein ENH89_14550 [Aurantimonas coralicida]|uniref:Uncharacterized protein n=1 Tax=Aurantimonas coralicida TaxID=182270 RepID=A0A9C9NHU3_9HYPH|nr:hypothetical protein [Aurantimonas coralicida]
MWTIHPDYPVARRRQVHHVVGDKGELLWSGKYITEAMAFIVEAGVLSFKIEDESESLVLRIMNRV